MLSQREAASSYGLLWCVQICQRGGALIKRVPLLCYVAPLPPKHTHTQKIVMFSTGHYCVMSLRPASMWKWLGSQAVCVWQQYQTPAVSLLYLCADEEWDGSVVHVFDWRAPGNKNNPVSVQISGLCFWTLSNVPLCALNKQELCS